MKDPTVPYIRYYTFIPNLSTCVVILSWPSNGGLGHQINYFRVNLSFECPSPDECQNKYGNANAWRYCCRVFDLLIIAAVSTCTCCVPCLHFICYVRVCIVL